MRKNIVLLLLLSLVGNAMAQVQQEMRLSLDEAMQYAEDHNYTLQNANLDIRKAEASRWQAISSMLPQISAGFDYQNMMGYEMKFGAGAMGGMSIPLNPNGTFNVQAAIAFTGAQVISTQLSRLAMDMTNVNLKKSRQTIRANVKNVYTSILVMEETVVLLDSSIVNMERLLRTTQDAVKAGASEQIAADKLSVQVASLRNSSISTRRSLQVLYNSLILQLGADVNSKLVLTTKVDEILPINEISALSKQSFDIDRNYDYQLLQKNEQIAKHKVRLAWMNVTPTISAYYQYSKKTYFGKSEAMNMTPPNVVGISVSQPLFKSGNIMSQIKSAKIDYMENINSRRQAEDGLRVQYNQLCYELATALDSYTIQKENLEVTKRVFDNTLEKFKYGMASNIEVTNASTDIITAQSNYIQAVLSVINAQVALENMQSE